MCAAGRVGTRLRGGTSLGSARDFRSRCCYRGWITSSLRLSTQPFVVIVLPHRTPTTCSSARPRSHQLESFVRECALAWLWYAVELRRAPCLHSRNLERSAFSGCECGIVGHNHNDLILFGTSIGCSNDASHSGSKIIIYNNVIMLYMLPH